MEKIAIISIGNELLEGRFVDTNTTWLAQQIFACGGSVFLHLTVRDRIEELVSALEYCTGHGATVIITTGGLGPTFDDKTIEAIARFTQCKTELHDSIIKTIETKYRDLFEKGLVDFPELNDARRKMAYLPHGGEPLENSVGISPGLSMEHEWGKIIALPGVPEEMKAIFLESCLSRLSAMMKGTFRKSKSIETTFKDESLLAPLLNRIVNELPGVYLKSHPFDFSSQSPLTVHLQAHALSEKEAQQLLDKAISILYLGQ